MPGGTQFLLPITRQSPRSHPVFLPRLQPGGRSLLANPRRLPPLLNPGGPPALGPLAPASLTSKIAKMKLKVTAASERRIVHSSRCFHHNDRGYLKVP